MSQQSHAEPQVQPERTPESGFDIGFYNWTPDEVNGFDELFVRIQQAESVNDWSKILADHLVWGNSKIAKSVGIFNMNSATDCPNLGTDNCQVPKESCYAFRSENMYGNPLDYRRRQEFIWDHLDAETWADAFLEVVSRKRNPVTALRFNQAGDFRHRGDIVKAERIAHRLNDEGYDVYTYSASDYLDWSVANHLTVNMSNARREYGDKHYTALPDGVDPTDVDFLDDNAVQCPYDKSDGADEFKCGNCRLCFESNGPDVYIRLH